MKIMNKYLTKFQLSIIGVGMLVVSLLTVLKLNSTIGTLINNLSDMDDIEDILLFAMSASSNLKICIYLYMILFIASILQIAGSVVQYIYRKRREISYVVYFFFGCMTVYGGVKLLLFVSGVKKLVSVGMQGATALLGGSLDADLLGAASGFMGVIKNGISLVGVINYTLIGVIFMGLYAGYCIYAMKKGIMPDSEALDEKMDDGDAFTFESGLANVREASVYAGEKAKETSIAVGEKTREASRSIFEKMKALTRKQKIIAGSLIAAVIIAIGGCGIYNTFFNYDKIDLITDMTMPTFSGYDGEGTVDVYPDIGGVDYDMTRADVSEFINDVSYSIDKTENLSNGDEVTVTATYSEQTAKALKIKVTEDTMTITVEGLIERYKDGDDISKDDLNSITAAMEEKAQAVADDYFDEKADCERMAVLFAKAREKNYGAYDDKLFGIYRLTHENQTSYVRVEVSGEMNKSVDVAGLQCEASWIYDNLKDALGSYADDDYGYVVTQIGASKKTAETLEDYVDIDIVVKAELEALQSEEMSVTIKGNMITYCYTFDFEIEEEEIKELKSQLKDEVEEEKDTFIGIASKIEEESGIEGITVKVKYVDKNGSTIYSHDFE